jgi:hypothetical protein
VKNVLYIVSNIFPTTLHTRFLPQSFASHHFTTHISPSHYTLLSPLLYAALNYTSLLFTSLHFFTLLYDFHFTSFHYTTLLNDFLHTLFFFNSPQKSLSLPSFSRYLVCRGEFLTLLQVAGSSLEWSYSQRNISLYPSFASYS